MRILALTPTFFPIMGGAELGIHEICRRLAENHAVRILTPVPTDRLAGAYGSEGEAPEPARYDVLRFADRINLKNAPGQSFLRGIVPPFSLSLAAVALRQAQAFRPDAVLAFYALPCGLAAARIRKKRRIPVLLSLIGRDVPGPGIPPLWERHVRRVMRAVDRTVFISEYCRQALGVTPGPGDDVIPFGVNSERFAVPAGGGAVREKLAIPPGARVLLSVQRLDPWKRVDVLIRAQALLLKEADAYLVIGGKGPEAGRLRALAHELGVSTRVLFAGYIPDRELPLYHAMADLFVFHSTYETFCLSLLQAMAAGNPIVSVRSTAIPELVRHGENGLLVEPGDAAGLARSVLQLLADAGMRGRFSRESRRRVRSGYDWGHVARRYEAALEQCLTGGRGARGAAVTGQGA